MNARLKNILLACHPTTGDLTIVRSLKVTGVCCLLFFLTSLAPFVTDGHLSFEEIIEGLFLAPLVLALMTLGELVYLASVPMQISPAPQHVSEHIFSAALCILFLTGSIAILAALVGKLCKRQKLAGRFFWVLWLVCVSYVLFVLFYLGIDAKREPYNI